MWYVIGAIGLIVIIVLGILMHQSSYTKKAYSDFDSHRREHYDQKHQRNTRKGMNNRLGR